VGANAKSYHNRRRFEIPVLNRGLLRHFRSYCGLTRHLVNGVFPTGTWVSRLTVTSAQEKKTRFLDSSHHPVCSVLARIQGQPSAKGVRRSWPRLPPATRPPYWVNALRQMRVRVLHLCPPDPNSARIFERVPSRRGGMCQRILRLRGWYLVTAGRKEFRHNLTEPRSGAQKRLSRFPST
jgi:hypothetical protein